MLKVTEISETQREYWDKEISKFECAHPLNAFYWGQVRSIDNWKPIYFAAEREGKFCGGMMVLMKKLTLLPFSIFYSPKGPVWKYDDDETLKKLVDKIKEKAKEENAIFMRVDPNIPETLIDTIEDIFQQQGFCHLTQRWSFWNSPRDVYRIDLSKFNEPENLFNMLDRDTRRCIRKAAKEGVTIEVATTEEDLKSFYDIFKEFSVNRGFMSRGYEYQKMLWETYITHDMGRLFLAKYNNKIIGGLICIIFSGKCLAMHMGTPYKFHKLQTYYAYVWESIKWAKTRGCLWYSFRGVGTTPSQEYFKSKFLPEVVSLVGYYDLPFKVQSYRLFYLIEFTVLPKLWSFLIRIREILFKTSKKIRRK